MNVVKEREQTHGEYSGQAQIAQNLKDLVRSSPGYLKMNPQQREGLEMICVKVARICAGDPYASDHWLDIQGYAALVHARLTPTNAVEDDIRAKASRLPAEIRAARIVDPPYDEADPRN